jgi:pseudouridine-5'-phosphate glycosidase
VDRLPGFHVRAVDIRLEHVAADVHAAAAVARARRDLGAGGVIVANPVPAHAATDHAVLEGWVETARAAARTEAVRGKAETPFLLARIAALSGGRTLAANRALLVANAALAAELAVALAATPRRAPGPDLAD